MPSPRAGGSLEHRSRREPLALDPATYDYLFERDEANLVVAGAATVELPETGEKIELREGNVAYFRAGMRSVWTITQPFTKFVVMPN